MPKTTQKSNQFTFRLVDLKTLKFNIEYLPEVENLPKGHPYAFSITPSTTFSDEEKQIIVDVNIVISLDNSLEKQVCNLKTRLKFEIKNYDEAIEIRDGNVSLPTNFMVNLIGIALSTSRGILAAKTEGSFLNGAFLPVVNPNDFKPI